IADEAKKIALCAGRIAADRWAGRPRHTEVAAMARTASELLRQAVGALDELDASRVADAAAREAQLDASLRGVLRSLISYMVEDPRTISSCLDLLFVAKSFERIGDHATNIFEHVIYAVHGENLRHAAPFSSQQLQRPRRRQLAVTTRGDTRKTIRRNDRSPSARG